MTPRSEQSRLSGPLSGKNGSYGFNPCPECDGTGMICEVIPAAGEYIDADYLTHDCEECSGTGEIECEIVCACCEGELRDDGWCPSCEESGLADVPYSRVAFDTCPKTNRTRFAA